MFTLHFAEAVAEASLKLQPEKFVTVTHFCLLCLNVIITKAGLVVTQE